MPETSSGECSGQKTMRHTLCRLESRTWQDDFKMTVEDFGQFAFGDIRFEIWIALCGYCDEMIAGAGCMKADWSLEI